MGAGSSQVERRTSHVRVSGRQESVEIPVISVSAPESGPSVVVTGNVHGDEYTGVLAALDLADKLEQALVCGAVHLYPSLNPPGLQSGARGLGRGGADLNRRFPGRRDGDFSHQVARAVWDDIKQRSPTLLVDLHADSAQSIAYAIVDRAVRQRGRERAEMDGLLRSLAEASGLTVLHEYPDDLYLRFGLDHSLAGATVNHLGVPAVTIESGPRRVLDQGAVRTTVDAVLGVLAHHGVVEGRAQPHASKRGGGPWRRTSGPRTRFDGLFEPSLPPGTVFERGDLLGRVRRLDGHVLEDVLAPAGGIVVSWVDGYWLPSGTVVATLGVLEGR